MLYLVMLRDLLQQLIYPLLLSYNSTQKSQLLMIELAIVVDAGEPFIKATYFLEGDGPLVFSCYEKKYGSEGFY